nr:GtrA family protein [uncultured Catonella sp.]
MKFGIMKISLKQIFNFVIVGVMAFIIDYTILLALTEFAGILYLVAAGISFSVAVIFNFYFSMRFVFDAKDKNKKEQFLIFLATSITGLILNEIGFWVFAGKIGIDYKLAKLIMTAIVMVFNFTTRKTLFENGKK